MNQHLPSLTPDTARDARIISRCHDKLAGRRAKDQSAARYVVERNALLGFGVIYLSSLALDLARVLLP